MSWGRFGQAAADNSKGIRQGGMFRFTDEIIILLQQYGIQLKTLKPLLPVNPSANIGLVTG
jgi:hypothetical protein